MRRLARVLVLIAGCGGGGADDSGGSRMSSAGAGGHPVTGAHAGDASDAGVDLDASRHELDGGDAGARNTVAPGELCDRLVTAQCDAEARCCATVARDVATCRAASLAGCETMLMLDAAAVDPRVGFDAAAASAVFAEYEARAAGCDPTLAPWAVSSAGFSSSFRGTLGPDDDCTPVGGLTAGAATVFAALASCDRDEGLSCLPTLTASSIGVAIEAWSCAPRSALGGPCATNLNCDDGSYCEGGLPNPNLEGTCAPAKAEGEPCSARSECASAACICDGAPCVGLNALNGTCAASDDVQAVFCL